MTDLAGIGAFACELGREAGALALRYFRTGLAAASKTEAGFDPVTAADLAIERHLREAIRRRYPTHGIVGEELPDESADASHCWVIDPIDGTRGFVLGLPTWGILLGLMQGGRPVLGLMYQPLTDDLVYGDGNETFIERAGARRPLAVQPASDLAQAQLCCTHPAMFEEPADAAAFARLATRVRAVRYGTDCYGYASLALGGAQLVVEGGLKPCDVIPLIPIVEGAGGLVRSWAGQTGLGARKIVAAADAGLLDATLAVLADRDR